VGAGQQNVPNNVQEQQRTSAHSEGQKLNQNKNLDKVIEEKKRPRNCSKPDPRNDALSSS
jgi:hypothetical protein